MPPRRLDPDDWEELQAASEVSQATGTPMEDLVDEELLELVAEDGYDFDER